VEVAGMWKYHLYQKVSHNLLEEAIIVHSILVRNC